MANIAIVVGQFHREHAERMVAAATGVCKDNGHKVVETYWVPGSMEKPLALKRALGRRDVDGAIVLGIIERGETGHGLVMAHAVVSNIIRLQIDTDKPVGVGILGPEIFPSQIEPRVVSYSKAAAAAVHQMLQTPGASE